MWVGEGFATLSEVAVGTGRGFVHTAPQDPPYSASQAKRQQQAELVSAVSVATPVSSCYRVSTGGGINECNTLERWCLCVAASLPEARKQ